MPREVRRIHGVLVGMSFSRFGRPQTTTASGGIVTCTLEPETADGEAGCSELISVACRETSAMVDHSDNRGPRPRNRDPSGAAADVGREPGEPSFLISRRMDSSRLGIIPSDRTSPSVCATATAIVSAWIPRPRNRTVPFRLWLCVVVPSNSQCNPRIAHRGHDD